jgi:16S rRNA (uracil1498-N3)-methyltransferase
MTTPRLLVTDAANGAVMTLPDDEAHHVSHVLRLTAGASVRVFDGRGLEWHARVETLGRAGVTVAIGESVDPVREPPVRVTLAIGLLKGDQMDAVVRDATMLGVAAIVPLISAHVATSWSASRLGSARERWRRVAVASVRQCGRAVVPEIRPARSFDELLTDVDGDAIVMSVEPSATIDTSSGADARSSTRPRSALLYVGPEGGWSEREVARALQAGARLLHLGPRTLRAETAPVVALAVLWTEWGWS